MTEPKTPVQLAVIGAPHGVRGEVRVKSLTGDPMALGDYGPLFAADGQRFTVLAMRPAKTVLVVRFKEIATREAAEAAAGTALFVDRSALPDDLDEDEFYHADLVGLALRDEDGKAIGKVIGVQNFGGGDIVEATMPGRGTVMIPFTLAAIPEVSTEGGFIRVDRRAAGLIDEDDDREGAA